MGNDSPIRIGVAGLGRAGWDIHIRAIRGRKDYVLTDVVDIDEKRVKEAVDEFKCAPHSDWKEFLKNRSCELVVVATQSKDHAPMSIQALKAGLHVLVEKPMATSLKDADKMIKAAKETGRILTVHQNQRLASDTLYVKGLLDSGILGRVFAIKRSVAGFSRRHDWQCLRKYGGGIYNNTGVHSMDQLVYLVNSRAVSVWGDLQQINNPGDVEDHVKVVFRCENGLTVDYDCTSVCAAPLLEWVIMGENGTAWIQGKKATVKYFDRSKLPKLEVEDLHQVPTRQYYREQIPWQEKTEDLPPGQNFYDHLYDSVRNGKPLLVTPESCREVYRVMTLARKGTKFPG